MEAGILSKIHSEIVWHVVVYVVAIFCMWGIAWLVWSVGITNEEGSWIGWSILAPVLPVLVFSVGSKETMTTHLYNELNNYNTKNNTEVPILSQHLNDSPVLLWSFCVSVIGFFVTLILVSLVYKFIPWYAELILWIALIFSFSSIVSIRSWNIINKTMEESIMLFNQEEQKLIEYYAVESDRIEHKRFEKKARKAERNYVRNATLVRGIT